MALTVYDPRTKAFRAFTTPNDGDLPLGDMLLLNIFIEMQTQTQILANLTPGADTEDPQNIRADIVSVSA